MSQFQYVARDTQGKTVKGSIPADSLSSFYSALREKGLYCLSYRESVDEKAARPKLHKMKTRELIIFCRKMGTMINSGLGITSAFEILYQTAETPALKALYLSVYESIQRGMSLSQAMRLENASFPLFLINMVESGETSGNLDSIMLTLAAHYENENKLMHKIKSATIYPIILLVVSVCVIILLFTFVLPNMMTMFQNAVLPPITVGVMAVSNFMVSYWPWIVLVVAAFVLIMTNSRYIPPLRMALDKGKLYSPFTKKMNRVIYSSRFSRSMALLYGSGIPLLSALRLSANVLGNRYIDRVFSSLLQDVSMGESLSSAIERANVFDRLMPSMVRIGEESGRLEQILSSIADYYNTESESAINRMIAILEPVMLVVLAVIITIILAAVLLPIYSMYSSLL
ncbi:MAG: type II secretion system F family protein [Christensenella sp.]|nr:type II secretion system F family protein [Christensenella sp.]